MSTGPKTLSAAGRWSKSLPIRLASRFEVIAKDDELLSLQDDIRLLDAFANEALSKLDEADSAASWDRALTLAKRMKTAKAPRRMELLQELTEVLIHGVGQDAVIREWRGYVMQRKELAVAEAARMQKLDAAVTERQLVIFTAQIVSIANEVISDKVQRTKLAKRLTQLCSGG